MNPVQQSSTISSPCYETIFICQSFSADTKNTENVAVGPPSRQRPGRSWDHARSSKTKIPGKKTHHKTKDKNQVPTGHLTNIHNPLETKPNLHHVFSPNSDSYGGSYFQKGGRATNHFGGLDVAPGCHCRVQRTWCHCWVPLQGAIVVCYGSGGGDDQLWRSTWCAIVVCYGWGGAFFLYIDNTKIGFCYLGSMLV